MNAVACCRCTNICNILQIRWTHHIVPSTWRGCYWKKYVCGFVWLPCYTHRHVWSEQVTLYTVKNLFGLVHMTFKV